jgi:ABC-type oligopeptide transport system ATPase subunit
VSAALEVSGVSRVFDAPAGMFATKRHVVAVDDVSFDLAAGGPTGW